MKPSTPGSYMIALTNTAPSRSADRATVAIPAGFTVSPASVQATATCGAPTWTVEQPVPTAEDKLSVKRPGGSQNNLCPGGTLTIAFSATSSAVEGAYTWTTELFRDLDTFVLSGSQPSTQVDGTAPVVTLTSSPPNPSNMTSPTFAFSAIEPASFSCKLDGGAFGACTSPKSYSGLGDGSHTFVVKATDAAGNTGPELSYTWLIETNLPIVMLTEQPSPASKSSTASFAFTASKPATFECRLDGGAFEACTSPRSYSGLADGAHTFGVKAIDAASNVGPETTHAWTVDTVAPTATITQRPENPSNNPAPSFVFAANEAVSFQCKLDGAAFAACTSPKSYTLGDGSHTFTVRATDPAGNTGDAAYTWTVDTVAPTVSITQKPPVASNNASPTFVFGANEPATFRCTLDTGSPEVCSSPHSYTGLSDGSHAFTLTATDAAGNTGQSSHAWTIDTVAPVATITQKPSNPSNVKTPEFQFSANEAASFQCKLDGAAFAVCLSPKSYTNLLDGVHTFTVKAIDPAGNTGEASWEWLLETVRPIVTLTQKPPNPSNTATATFAFEPSKPATLQCRLDGPTFSDCSSPKVFSNLSDGLHTFAVRATDAANNTGPETLYAWTVDTLGPTAAITAGPGDPTNSGSAMFTFASEAGATFQCRLDGAAFASCTSPQSYSGLGDGRHTFSVRASDAVSNIGPEAVYAWTIETRSPVVSVTAGPPALGNSTTATLSFSADEPSTYQCNLDERGFEPCSSPASYAGLGEGGHAFVVRATDAAGNVGAASRAWVIDVTAPETKLDSVPAARTTSTSATFRFSASEASSFQCRLDGGSFSPCTSPRTHTRLASGRHSFAVRAVDSAGNVDATPAVSQWAVTRVTRTVAASALFAPAAGARVTRPPLLRWRSVRGARYYNVQLYRAGRKVLTAWPTRTRLQLKAKWRFQGRVQQLRPGVYRWYVWPAYGRASARRYGPLLGTTTFVVGRAARRR